MLLKHHPGCLLIGTVLNRWQGEYLTFVDSRKEYKWRRNITRKRSAVSDVLLYTWIYTLSCENTFMQLRNDYLAAECLAWQTCFHGPLGKNITYKAYPQCGKKRKENDTHLSLHQFPLFQLPIYEITKSEGLINLFSVFCDPIFHAEIICWCDYGIFCMK